MNPAQGGRPMTCARGYASDSILAMRRSNMRDHVGPGRVPLLVLDELGQLGDREVAQPGAQRRDRGLVVVGERQLSDGLRGCRLFRRCGFLAALRSLRRAAVSSGAAGLGRHRLGRCGLLGAAVSWGLRVVSGAAVSGRPRPQGPWGQGPAPRTCRASCPRRTAASRTPANIARSIDAGPSFSFCGTLISHSFTVIVGTSVPQPVRRPLCVNKGGTDRYPAMCHK